MSFFSFFLLMEKSILWYDEKQLFHFENVTRRGNNVHTEMDYKAASGRSDITLGDIVVYKYCLADRLYAGKVYKTRPDFRAVMLGYEPDLYPPSTKRGESVGLDAAYIAKAIPASPPCEHLSRFVYRFDATPQLFESMHASELEAHVAQQKQDALNRHRADVEAHKCSACVSLYNKYNKQHYALKKSELETPLKTGQGTLYHYLYLISPAVQSGCRRNGDTEYHCYIEYAKIGVFDQRGALALFEKTVDVENGTFANPLPDPTLHTSPDFIDHACADVFELCDDADMSSRVHAFVKSKTSAFDTRVKSAVRDFPKTITKFADFRNAYNDRYPKTGGTYFFYEHRARDAALLWDRYQRYVLNKQPARKIKK